jgi:hypothetical protein
VIINGELVGTLPLAKPTRVGDGPVRVEVRAPKWRTSTRALTMVRGKKQGLEVHLMPESVPSRAEDSTSTHVSATGHEEPGILRYARPTAWVLAAGATAALGFGLVEHLVWAGKRNDFDNHTVAVIDPTGGQTAERVRDCGLREPNRGGEECQRLHDQMSSAKTLALVGYATGAILAAGSATLSAGGEDSNTGLLGVRSHAFERRGCLSDALLMGR